VSGRKEFSRKTKAAAWARCNGICEGTLPDGRRCYVPLTDHWHEYHHVDPDWFSKNNELENCLVLCRACHVIVTRKNKADIAKSKRIRDKRSGALKAKRPFRGWRNFRGEAVWRDQG
jgi:hypothetical protein